jgi:hypothetical protein
MIQIFIFIQISSRQRFFYHLKHQRCLLEIWMKINIWIMQKATQSIFNVDFLSRRKNFRFYLSFGFARDSISGTIFSTSIQRIITEGDPWNMILNKNSKNKFWKPFTLKTVY